MSDDDSYYNSTESEESDEELHNKHDGISVKKKTVTKNDDDDDDVDDVDVDVDVDDVDDDSQQNDNEEESEIEDDINQIADDDDDDQVGGGDDQSEYEENNDSDIEIDEEGDVKEKSVKQLKVKKSTQLILDDEDDDDEDEYEENYLQKFDNELNRNYITEFHPECLFHNNDEISKLSNVIRDENNIIIDPLHKTLPYLTKYEKARVLGQRAKQIETGAKPLVKIPENIIDSYVIAELELREKKIPFIIKRPIPGGGFEYWNLRDLENINF